MLGCPDDLQRNERSAPASRTEIGFGPLEHCSIIKLSYLWKGGIHQDTSRDVQITLKEGFLLGTLGNPKHELRLEVK